MNGILLVNKDPGITSHDVVVSIRKLTGIKRVGHAGTLDPIATGLLLLGINQACKILRFLADLDKEYNITMKLGVLTDTLDKEGTVIRTGAFDHIKKDDFFDVVKKFEGETEQVVPAFSAVKLKGKRLYKLARAGITLDLPRRKIKIYSIQIIDFDPPLARLLISCSRGTYVRAVARDIAEKLGTVAICQDVARMRIGTFKLDDAVKLRDLQDQDSVEKRIVAIDKALDFMPDVYLTREQESDLLKGQSVELKCQGGLLRVYGRCGFVGIGRCFMGRILQPVKVFQKEALT